MCQIMWIMRHVVLSTAFVLRAGDGALGRTDLVVGAALVAQLVGHLISRRRRSVAPVVVLADGVLAVVFAALGLPAFLVFVIAIGILGWAATYRPVVSVGALGAVVLAVVTTASAHEVSAPAAVVAFCMLSGVFIVRATRLNMGARRAEEREELVAERIDAVLWEEDLDAGGLKVSRAAERLLGYPLGAWLEPGFARSVVHPDDQPRVDDAMRGDGAVTVRVRRSDGSWRWMDWRTNRVADRSGATAFRVGVLVDRTDQVEAEREALAFGHLVASSPIGNMLLHCDGDGPVVDAINGTGRRILGLAGDATGRRLSTLLDERLQAGLLLGLFADGQTARSIELTGLDGRIYEATALHLDERSCSMHFLDITERVESSRRLHEQARRDHLTGLPNRRALVEAIEHRVTVAGDEPTSVLLIDLDRFKDINDSLGHETGDQFLHRIGQRIVSRCAGAEFVARLGGDEFAVVLPGATPAEAMARAWVITEVIKQPVVVGDLRLRVLSSLGVASYPHDASTTTELLRCADVAMYHAKSRSTGVESYDPENATFGRDRLTLVADLETAIDSGQLILHHQPLIETASGRVIGTEALARWNHPARGLMPPDQFIELAEVSGQIRKLTRWVIRRALRELRDLGPAALDIEVSVNLSVRNLYEPDLLDWITAELTLAGVAPSRLVVEITESTIMDDQAAAIELIRGLRDLGVRTWIDDFGTGHSSFARLRSLPVHGVKIDRSFVAAAGTSMTDRIILQSLINLVHSLGLQVVAEGVETAESLALLRELDCETAQGFHLGRPAPIDVIASGFLGIGVGAPR